MNKIIALICCIAISKTAFAQKDSLALDERGKYIYYKVEELNKYNADVLYKRSLLFFANLSKDKTFKVTGQDANTTSINGSGFFIVYKPSLAKHPDGQVSYTLKMEVKDAKYRFWLTDFVYTPYFRDRYNNYVPDKGITATMEKPSKILDEKNLDKFLGDLGMFARQLGDKLKRYLLTESVAVSKKDTVTKKVIHINKTF